jgi:hypothetical protein
MEFLVHGVTRFSEPGVFIAFERTIERRRAAIDAQSSSRLISTDTST